MWDALPEFTRLIFSLAFVLALMGGLYFILKKLGLSGPPDIPGKNKRLKIIETLGLDARRRLVLIQRDDVKHLVILGINGETVVETNIEDPDIPLEADTDEPDKNEA